MPDTTPEVAFNPLAPQPERFDAQVELHRTYQPLASALPDVGDVRALVSELEESAHLLKASNLIPFPGRAAPPPERGMRSVQIDEMQVFPNGEYYEKQSPIGFEGLRSMVEQVPILSAIVMTRVRQVNRFCSISEDGGPGFEIRHVDRKHKLAGDEADAAQMLGRFMANCGWEFVPRKRKLLKRDNFAGFMAKSVRDSLSMDSAPIEIEPKRAQNLGLDGFYAVDGTTIRLCSEDGYDGDDRIFALQVVQGRVATAYNHSQLIYEVRNPRADVRLAGYGLGEPELLVKVVTGFLNGLTYNLKGLDENAIPKGLLHLSGEYGPEDIASFKRYWNAMVRGVNNAWTMPVMVSKDQESKASFERFGIDFNEMYFSKWMTFLTAITCSIYGMDPAEINFESFSDGRSSLSGSDTEERLTAAQDKGLRPLMAYYEQQFSDFIVAEFDPNLCFRWVGLDEEDQGQALDKQKLTLRVDEMRALQGYEPDPLYGDAPLNPSLVGVWQMQKQQQMQPQGDYGQPDDEQGGGDRPPSGGDRGQKDGQPPLQAPSGGAPGGGEFGGGNGQAEGDFGSGADGQGFGKAMSIWSVGD